MTFLYNVLPFPASSRLTGIWSNRNVDPPADDEIASGHFLLLPDDQHADLEGDFLTAHLPFWVAGLGGAFPDGQPWLFVLQKAPADASLRLVGADDPAWVLRDSLFRALRFNDGACLREEFIWSRGDLLGIYEWIGIDPDDVEDWSVVDLLRGLLTECCCADLGDVVAGYSRGCAFPDIEHDCAGDTFNDVFARWASGQMTPAEDDQEDADEEDDEDEDWDGTEVTATDLSMLTRRELEALAEQFDIRVRRKSNGTKRSRRKLIQLILAAATDDGDGAA